VNKTVLSAIVDQPAYLHHQIVLGTDPLRVEVPVQISLEAR